MLKKWCCAQTLFSLTTTLAVSDSSKTTALAEADTLVIAPAVAKGAALRPNTAGRTLVEAANPPTCAACDETSWLNTSIQTEFSAGGTAEALASSTTTCPETTPATAGTLQTSGCAGSSPDGGWPSIVPNALAGGEPCELSECELSRPKSIAPMRTGTTPR